MKIKKAFDRLRKLQVTLDDVQGYFLVRQAKLDRVERMAVILQTGGSLAYEDVRNALKGFRDDRSLEKTAKDYQGDGAGQCLRRPRVAEVVDEKHAACARSCSQLAA